MSDTKTGRSLVLGLANMDREHLAQAAAFSTRKDEFKSRTVLHIMYLSASGEARRLSSASGRFEPGQVYHIRYLKIAR